MKDTHDPAKYALTATDVISDRLFGAIPLKIAINIPTDPGLPNPQMA